MKTACDAASLGATAFTHRAASAGSENFDFFKGASGFEHSVLWSHVYDRFLPFL